MSTKSIIVCGPRGCGKTRNAETIRKYYKLSEVIDGGKVQLKSVKFKDDGVLYLTDDMKEANKLSPQSIVPYSFVARHLKLK